MKITQHQQVFSQCHHGSYVDVATLYAPIPNRPSNAWKTSHNDYRPEPPPHDYTATRLSSRSLRLQGNFPLTLRHNGDRRDVPRRKVAVKCLSIIKHWYKKKQGKKKIKDTNQPTSSRIEGVQHIYICIHTFTKKWNHCMCVYRYTHICQSHSTSKLSHGPIMEHMST